ncbi:MAG: prepilin-type N-terminal cleavage/methylation domain-containing protein [Planctomycetota bacterium]
MASETHNPDAGFTLLEVLIAVAILSMALLTMTALRTESLVTATEARNLRVASALADQYLSEVAAGEHDIHEFQGIEEAVVDRFPHGDFENFRWMVLVGEARIQEEITKQAEYAADSSGTDADYRALDRLHWLEERRNSERAQENGGLLEDEEEEVEEDDTPDEDTFEDVAVFVYYPSPRSKSGTGICVRRSRVTTLALSGFTLEQVSDQNVGLDSNKETSEK